MQTAFTPYYSRSDDFDSEISYSYDTDCSVSDIDYSFLDNVDCDYSPVKDSSFLNLDINTDDLIIIGIVIFLFAEGSVDFTTLAALGLLFFSNNT